LAFTLGIISKGLHLYSTRRLREAAADAGAEVLVIDPRRCMIVSNTGRRDLLLDGIPLEPPQAVIPRIGIEDAELSLAVLRQLELQGSSPINRSESIALAKNKYSSLQLLSKEGLPVPKTVYLKDPFQLSKAFELLGGPPYVLKLPEGSKGIGILLAESASAAEAMVDAIWRLGSDVLLQEFIGPTAGEDLRVLILGRKAVASVRRTAKTGHFRSNVHLGAEVHPAPLDPRKEQLAIQAARALGLEMAGIDLLSGSDGNLVVLEANASPGFEGVERATGKDIAGMVVRHALRKLESAGKA